MLNSTVLNGSVLNNTYIFENSTATAEPSLAPITNFVMWLVFGLIGNGLCITMLICSAKTHNWKIFYQLVLVLCISDTLSINIPVPIVLAAYSKRNILETGNFLCTFMASVGVITSFISLLVATFLSIDRFMAISYPIFYKKRIKSRHYYITLLCICFFSIIVGLLPIFGISKYVTQYQGNWCFPNLYPREPKDKFFSVLCSSILILAVMLMIVFNVIVIIRLYQLLQKAESAQRQSKLPKRPTATIKKIVSIIFVSLLTLVFVCTWIPVSVRLIENSTGHTHLEPKKDNMVIVFSVLSQLFNPWIYIILRESLFTMCFRYGKRHSRHGSIFHKILHTTDSKEMSS